MSDRSLPASAIMGGLGFAFALLAVVPRSATSQAAPVGSPLEGYVRILELLGKAAPGSVAVRPYPVWHGLPVADTVEHPWQAWLEEGAAATRPVSVKATLDPARVRIFLNSAIPYGGNDGAIWQGKGITTALDAGGTLDWGPLSASLHPELIFTQNGSFPLAPVDRAGASMYGYPWRRIDLPQRFGPDPFWTLASGQSKVRFTWRGVTVGFGTESLWWGPGIDNAILMSNNAPGFPHAILATAHPVDIGIGTVDAQWVWGRLEESGWADSIPESWYESTGTTERRFFTGIVGSFRPRGLTGWTLGGARVYTMMVPRGGLGLGEYFLVLQQPQKEAFASEANPAGDDQRDQILSLFARWARPGSGFEAYAEWSRNDHSWDFRDFIFEPEHSQGYILGFQQAVPLAGNRILAVRSELTHLERAPTFQARAEPTYYAHHLVPPGYTHRGQVIGAAVGPGGNSQSLAVDLYAPWGRAGLFLLREVHDNDAYWVVAARDDLGPGRHDVSTGLGARWSRFFGQVAFGADALLTKEYNRYFARNTTHNVNVRVSAQWRWGSRAHGSRSEGGP